MRALTSKRRSRRLFAALIVNLVFFGRKIAARTVTDAMISIPRQILRTSKLSHEHFTQSNSAIMHAATYKVIKNT